MDGLLAVSWLVPFLPLLAFALLTLFGSRLGQGAAWLSILFTGVAAVLAVLLLSPASTYLQDQQHPYQWGFSWLQIGSVTVSLGVSLTGLNLLMLPIVSVIALLVQVYAVGYMHGDARYPRFFAYMSLFTGSMLALVVSPNFLQLYIFWEMVGLCSYLLIGFWYQRSQAAKAAKKAFIVTRIGDVGLLVAIFLIFAATGSFEFSAVIQAVQSRQLGGGFVTAIALLIFLGAAGKSAQFPLHVWLPDAMEGPTPVSALIHAATMVAAGVYLVALTFPIFAASAAAMQVVAWIGAISAFLAATIALAQTDFKRVIAYSTISQLGYMMLGLGVGSITAGMFHLTTHAVFKALLFLAVGAVIHEADTQELDEVSGLWGKMKITAITFFIGALALSGIPPFAGFWSKDGILAAVVSQGNWGLAVLGFLTVLLTAFYIWRIGFRLFFGEQRAPHGYEKVHEAPLMMMVPMGLLALGAIGTGFFGGNISRLLGSGAVPEAGWGVAILATVLALVGIGAAFLTYLRPGFGEAAVARLLGPVWIAFKRKYWIDEGYQAGVVRPTLALAAGVRQADGNIIDTAVESVGAAPGAIGEGVARAQTGRAQTYLAVGTIAVVLLVIVSVIGGSR